ncbi:hypothetical protein BC830DRAFT_1101524 [Chytriomyces sp. MP71]|nr:hypothetical protein BC830DRAFT_1101524 [Chytriomyces sp. MP71]
MSGKGISLTSVNGALARVILVAIAISLHQTLDSLKVGNAHLTSVQQRPNDGTPLVSHEISKFIPRAQHRPLVSIPRVLPPPFASVFNHPYTLVLATRRCNGRNLYSESDQSQTNMCTFVGPDLKRNVTFTQSGHDHVWIDNVKDAKHMHEMAHFVLESSWNQSQRQERDRPYMVAISIPETPKYGHLSSPVHVNSYSDGLDTSVSLESEISALFKSRPFPDALLVPTLLPSTLRNLIPSSCKVVQTSRIDALFPTALEFLEHVHKTNPPSIKSSHAKRSEAIAFFGLPACSHIHTGAVGYLSRFADAADVQVYGPAPGSCLPAFLGKEKDSSTAHFARAAASHLVSVLFLDLMEGSGGGIVLPHLVLHALAGWDSVLVVVSKYDVRRYFPCPIPREGEDGCVLWVDPTRQSANSFADMIKDISRDRKRWQRILAWRRGEDKSLFGKEFSGLWEFGMKRAVCEVCKVATGSTDN